MNKVISKDGTLIAYDRLGQGPALILVDGALCSRHSGPAGPLAALLQCGKGGLNKVAKSKITAEDTEHLLQKN